jgi:hypothetical protein
MVLDDIFGLLFAQLALEVFGIALLDKLQVALGDAAEVVGDGRTEQCLDGSVHVFFGDLQFPVGVFGKNTIEDGIIEPKERGYHQENKGTEGEGYLGLKFHAPGSSLLERQRVDDVAL